MYVALQGFFSNTCRLDNSVIDTKDQFDLQVILASHQKLLTD